MITSHNIVRQHLRPAKWTRGPILLQPLVQATLVESGDGTDEDCDFKDEESEEDYGEGVEMGDEFRESCHGLAAEGLEERKSLKPKLGESKFIFKMCLLE
ncbi:hypothetical protein DVH24_039373 [Malus domestica]|uniref:Uncharacterized protein n=1 Tax=Malus domestica TaxID=3750 RepID=A0A498HZZ0_MALDO|nr:hypothetical protein DVH24_039373 [Malus domestica]